MFVREGNRREEMWFCVCVCARCVCACLEGGESEGGGM